MELKEREEPIQVAGDGKFDREAFKIITKSSKHYIKAD
jgi:hypothetical protein